MGLWHSISQGLSGAKNAPSPADASHKKLFIELATLAIIVLCLPFIIWWMWGYINNLGRWKVTDSSKADRKHYIKTWHGFTEREKVDRRKQARKEVREKFRSMFVWKTTRADYNWVFWDPDGSKKAEFDEERNDTWLRHLPRWMRSRGYGSLQHMMGGSMNPLGDAEKGLPQSPPFHNSDEIRSAHPFDTNQLHQAARVNSLQVDGGEPGTCTMRTGITMDGATDGSSTTFSTICRRRLPQGTSRVFAAESAETNRAVQLQLFTSDKEHERREVSSTSHEAPGGCVDLSVYTTVEEVIADYELLPTCDAPATQAAPSLPQGISPGEGGLPSACAESAYEGVPAPTRSIILEVPSTDCEVLPSRDESLLEAPTSASPGSEDPVIFTKSVAWKKREAASVDASSRSSNSSMPSPFFFGPPRPKPRPNAQVARHLNDLRIKPLRAPRVQVIAVRNGSQWSTLESPEVEHYSQRRQPSTIRFQISDDAHPQSIVRMIRDFRESSPSYHRDPFHSRIHTISDASEADVAADRSPLKSSPLESSPTKPIPKRTYGSIKLSKLRNTIRAASVRLHIRKTTTHSRRAPNPYTPTSRTTQNAPFEVAISEADSGEWELDWDPEVYERGWGVEHVEEVVERKASRGRESLSTKYKQILEKVMRRKSSGPRKSSSGLTSVSK
ncbi:MAG: hypothetical protein LQ347_002833 [Umbilicaria vellea]|nr:MAG: hypothetical protein LQ347_002833 [Umbilicaria vellea]